jgi:hypothetical protein
MQALMAEVLASWRQAEKAASESRPGTAEYEAAMAAEERLHQLYRELSRSEVLSEEVAIEVRRTLAEYRLPAGAP